MCVLHLPLKLKDKCPSFLVVEFSWVELYIRDQSEECRNKFQAGNYGMNVNSFGSREEVIAVDCQESG